MKKKKLNIPVTTLFAIVHLVALAGFYPFFTLEGLILALVSTPIFGMAITVVYHRYLTHKGFKTSTFMHRALSIWGMLAGEGPPLIWVANHLDHHGHSDEDGDPHSPKHGFWHSHMGWMMKADESGELNTLFMRYVPKLQRDPFMRMLNRTYIWWHVAVGFLLFGIGYLYAGPHMGGSLVIYGLFIRMMLVWHITWAVNSVTHVWGYRTYETTDDSRNNWLVAFFAVGEGWHNNHHAFPACARAGHRWWEIDISYLVVIWPLKMIRIIWDVNDKLPDKSKRLGT